LGQAVHCCEKHLVKFASPGRLSPATEPILSPLAPSGFVSIGTAPAQLLAQHLLTKFKRLAPVFTRMFFGAISITRLDCLQEVAMLGDRLGWATLVVERAGLKLPNVNEQRLKSLQQAIVVRRATDELMELRGKPPQCTDVATSADWLHIVQ